MLNHADPPVDGCRLSESEERGGKMSLWLGLKELGRSIVIKYKCMRCGATAYLEYEELKMLCGEMQRHYTLKDLYAPKGWSHHDGGLYCPKCSCSYKHWFQNPEED